MSGADMRCEFLVASRLKNPFHRVERIADGRTGRVKDPCTLGTTPTTKARLVNPHQLARHRRHLNTKPTRCQQEAPAHRRVRPNVQALRFCCAVRKDSQNGSILTSVNFALSVKLLLTVQRRLYGWSSLLRHTCAICSKAVSLSADLTADENGKAVHEECYVNHVTSSHRNISAVAAD